MSEALGTLSRDEKSLATALTATDLMAWLDAHKPYIDMGSLAIYFDNVSGAWRAVHRDGGVTAATFREALTALVNHENGVAERAGWAR